MTIKDIIKLNFLFLGFCLSVYIIYKLNTSGLSPAAQQALGLATTVMPQSKDFTLKWCDTRVTSIVVLEQFKIYQEGRKWLIESGQKNELNFLAVEKWFAANCALGATKVTIENPTDFKPLILIKFVNNQTAILKVNPEGVFLWRDIYFKSEAFANAIRDLGMLPKK